MVDMREWESAKYEFDKAAESFVKAIAYFNSHNKTRTDFILECEKIEWSCHTSVIVSELEEEVKDFFLRMNYLVLFNKRLEPVTTKTG